VIAGATSGVGKTTVATALMGALTRRGLRVRPFKAGPDYIDPTYHASACGSPSRNLDTWMLQPEAVRELFCRATSAADVAVVEGVMGLFDGRDEPGQAAPAGSTAELAKLLEAPVVVVLDVTATAQSAAAMALGYQRLDPDVRVAGFVLNNVAGDGHRESAAAAIRRATGLPVLGAFPRDPGLVVPERHLGLVPTTERQLADGFVDRLALRAEACLDLDGILALAKSAAALAVAEPGLFPETTRPSHVRLAVAQDEAFGFYYQDGLDLLAAWAPRSSRSVRCAIPDSRRAATASTWEAAFPRCTPPTSPRTSPCSRRCAGPLLVRCRSTPSVAA
jgi:cobyrinic acid a,c-diamide synthase